MRTLRSHAVESTAETLLEMPVQFVRNQLEKAETKTHRGYFYRDGSGVVCDIPRVECGFMGKVCVVMKSFCIDPGNTESAYVILQDYKVIEFSKVPNDHLLTRIYEGSEKYHYVCEMIACYGMPVGAEVFETCVWIGRFQEASRGTDSDWSTITRVEVKKRLCFRTSGVNDAVIRQRCIDLYGGKETAIGNKKAPGPLYGVAGDCWSALAVGCAWQINNAEKS